MSLPYKPTRSGTRGYAHLVEIGVPAARVWRALTDPALVRIWSGQEAEIEAREGGFYRLGKRHLGGREAHIDIFDPSRRLRLIYLSEPDLPNSQSAVVDDLLLDVRQGKGTALLRILGSGIPDTADWDKPYLRMRQSWERFMARIKFTLETPPPKPKVDEPKDPPLAGLDY